MNPTIDNEGVICRVQPVCGLCGRPGAVVHSGMRDLIFGTRGEWGFRRCADPACALLWLDPMPLPGETSKFYETYYTHAAESSSEATAHSPRRGWKSVVKQGLAKILFWRKHVFLSGLSYLEDMTPGRMLEIGCGNGSLLRSATGAGWRAFGIDFDANAIAAAQTIPNVEAAVGDLLSMSFGENMFDAIVMNNVIEHLPAPHQVFRECQRILRPGGRLVMVTPNIRSLGYRQYGQDWRGLEAPRHLHIFSPGTLAAFARSAQFERVAAFSTAGGGTGIESLLFSQALREKRLRRGAQTDELGAKRSIAEEVASILVGRDVGEFAVLVAHK